MQKGFARPGYFFIDGKGIIREKFFDARYHERLTGNSLWASFSRNWGKVTETVEAPHLQLALEQADATGFPGTRIALAVEVRLPPDVHVYAPGTKGHKPIKLLLDPIPQLQLQPWFIRHRKRAMCGRSRNKCPFLRDPCTSARIFRWLRERSSGVRLAKTGKLSRSPESSSIRRATRSRVMR
jgi:hypothetical protein